MEGPAREFMSIADVCSYLGWKSSKLYRLIRERSFPRPRTVPGRGRGWYGRDIAAYRAIEELLGGADPGETLPAPRGVSKKHPQQKSGEV